MVGFGLCKFSGLRNKGERLPVVLKLEFSLDARRSVQQRPLRSLGARKIASWSQWGRKELTSTIDQPRRVEFSMASHP